MPYNTAPIAPPKEPIGATSLPLARVKKIIQADDDIGACSNNAAFCIAIAAELFVRYLVEQTHKVVKSERRPRRNIQYKDIANAVARIDNLEFLIDVVPKTMTYKAYKEKRATQEARAAENTQTHGQGITNGQRTLDNLRNPDGRDEEMRDVEAAETNGHGELQKGTAASSSRSPTTARQSGHRFDAIRNELTEPMVVED